MDEMKAGIQCRRMDIRKPHPFCSTTVHWTLDRAKPFTPWRGGEGGTEGRKGQDVDVRNGREMVARWSRDGRGIEP